ncbi:MAG TPA: serine/threonine-protein kinase [Kofleriaceae bacterium]|nr:serine/threonine-protein kinase [Kofleriaceae bacterium]
MLGETIGNYKVISLLGSGGMGDVFLAEQAAIGTLVAIKVLQTHVSKDAEHVQRFFNEARAVSRVRHAGTVKIFDCGFHQGHAYLVMEYLEGESLAARIRRLGVLPGAQVLDIGRQIASVLDAVHHAGVTHRDLKPDNIHLIPDQEMASGERVKVLDFGIAKLSGTTVAGSPQTKGTMGTPAYMAPEQWNNAADVDGRADTYSLGCLLFEMASGRTPFPARSIGEACTHHLHTPPPHVAAVAPHVPARLDALIHAMLAKDPAHRPSLKDVARTFDELRGGSAPWPVVAPPGGPPAMPPTIVPQSGATQPTVTPGTHPPPVVPEPPSTIAPPIAPPVAPRRRTGLIVGLTIGGLAGAGVVIGLATRPGAQDHPVARDAAVPSPDATAVIDAPPPIDAPPQPPRDALLATNPFVDVHGVRVLAHQVTAAEYTTVRGEPAPDPAAPPSAPVAWVSQADAIAFCAEIDGHVPTSDEWAHAANGAWGIESAGVIGPLQEWTSTLQDELVVVRGAHAGMKPDALAKARHQKPPYFLQKEVATAGADRNVYAGATIGFRCVDGPPPRTDKN